MKALIGTIALTLSLAAGCARRSDDAAPAASRSASVPHIKLSDQPRLRGDAGIRRRTPNPEAVAAGKKLHQMVAKQCSDDACRYARCSPLCSQWLREQQGDSGAPKLGQQRLFFDCVGFCMNPSP